MELREIGEFGLIDRLREKLQLADETVLVGIGDDAAVVTYTPGFHVVMTTDMLVAGIHFREDTIDYQSLGWKSMAASISDIAAMGGIPRHAMVSLAIPADFQVEKLDLLYEGIAEIGRTYQTHVIGGDIVKTDGPLLISVSLTGEVEPGKALLRSGARPGDLVFVTGRIGGSAAGLAFLETKQQPPVSEEEQEVLLRSHQRPKPQVEAGRILLNSGGCTSCNDISDGLASELNEIALASGVRIQIEEGRLPIAPAVTNFGRWVEANSGTSAAITTEWALFGGEDYQLVGTLNPSLYPAIASQFQAKGLRLTILGQAMGGQGVVLQQTAGGERLLQARGYNHFAE